MSLNSPDLTGFRSGRLTAVERAHMNSAANAYWKCKCDCGRTCVVRAHSIARGLTKSCGCWRREASKERMRKVRASRAVGTRYSFDDVVAGVFANTWTSLAKYAKAARRIA